MDEITQNIVDRLERMLTTSGALIRAAVYDEMAKAGVNVPKLVETARSEATRQAEDAIEARAARIKALQARIAAGKLPLNSITEAKKRVQSLDVRDKADRKQFGQMLKQFEARRPPPLPSAPTAERLRQAAEAPVVKTRDVDETPLTAPRYELAWVVDRVAVAMDANHYAAAVRLRKAFETRNPSARVVDLNGAGGGAPGSRSLVQDRHIIAGEDWDAVWPYLPDEMRRVVRNFILEQPRAGRDRTMSSVEFGREFLGVRDEKTARGAALASVKLACITVASLYHQHDARRGRQRLEARSTKRQGAAA